MSDDVKYEENPWGDDEPIFGPPVKGLLPTSEEMRHAIIRFNDGERIYFSLPEDDMAALNQVARGRGETPESLLAGIVHEYLAAQRS